ncbi:IMS-domain-containing protein [Athelia psychrophila]|uniref:DNA polymerase kappa n=1 Tax=Athelia psychrophila TaxID=1759441 RepID=A0A166KXP6_9AGAM|nr:IMS-domain-containing protein [Fibularhizoctonia sp. CBS 109695]
MALDGNDHPPSQDTASLVRRLAGPSTTKAGLALDQSEINRIIAEASKGSKFYENEKKKDKELTQRIDRILKERDDIIQGADLQQAERRAEKILVDLESERDLTQYIVHIDMDAFFANVEMLHQPELAGKPFGVGRGVLTTASYEARKYGVRSGMPGFIAKKLCPELILVPINFHRYTENSDKVMDVFRRYDPNLCAAGCDEAYLNITAYCTEHSIDPETCVQEMRAAVQAETKLTASAGIAPNKMLAKICSDKNKPNGQFFLPFDRASIVEFMRDLSIRKIQGVGRVHERVLDAMGIKTCGDIWALRGTLELMDKQFGVQFLLRTHLGIASNVVRAGQRDERKSVGAERTFTALSDKTRILRKLEEIAAELESDLDYLGFTGRTVTLKYKLDTYQVFSRAKSFGRCISTKKEDLFAIGKELLLAELPLTIRLIGLRVTKLTDLRAPSPAAGGIRKFFEPANTTPNKRPKLDGPHDPGGSMAHPLTVDSDFADMQEQEDAMPGFYEHEDDVDLGAAAAIDACDQQSAVPGVQDSAAVAGPSKPRPPVSAPARTSSKGDSSGNASSTASLGHSSKPRSASNAQAPRIPQSLSTTLECPICSKMLETDNQGLNAHIDFCLSKGAIMAAQVKASPARGSKSREKTTGTKKRKR